MRYFQQMLRSEFWRNVFTLFSGSLISQAIGVISIVVLPRLYSDTEFGVFGFFTAMVAGIAVIISGGYETAVMLPETQKAVHRLVKISIALAALGCTLLGIMMLVGGNWFLSIAEVPELQGWHLLIPLSILLEGLGQPLRTALNKNKKYKILSISKVARSLAWLVISGGMGWLEYGFEGIILGFMGGQLAGLAILGIAYLPLFKDFGWDFQLKEMKPEARRYGDFLRFGTLSAFLNTASKQLPFYLLIPIFDAGVAGQFTQADRVLNLPAVLISMSIGGVFYQQATKAKIDGPQALAKLTLQTFWRLAALGLPFLVVIMVAGPWLFGWVLGEEWTEAGVYARWLMPWLFMVFIASPLSYLIDIQRKLREFLYYNIALFVVRLITIWIGGLYFSPVETMMLYGFSGMVMVGFQIIYLLHIGGVISLRASKKTE